MKKIALAIMALAFLGMAGSAFAADPNKDLAACKACHDITNAAKKKVGPALWGVYGRAPSITGVPFATWDDAALDKWLTKPSDVKKGTPMSFPGIKDDVKRKAAIEALKSMK